MSWRLPSPLSFLSATPDAHHALVYFGHQEQEAVVDAMDVDKPEAMDVDKPPSEEGATSTEVIGEVFLLYDQLASKLWIRSLA